LASKKGYILNLGSKKGIRQEIGNAPEHGNLVYSSAKIGVEHRIGTAS
jgi:hypothetical protein